MIWAGQFPGGQIRGKTPRDPLAAGLCVVKRPEINLSLPSSVSPSISGEWQLFTLCAQVSAAGEKSSVKGREPGGAAAGRGPSHPAQEGVLSLLSVPWWEGRGDSKGKEQWAPSV